MSRIIQPSNEMQISLFIKAQLFHQFCILVQWGLIIILQLKKCLLSISMRQLGVSNYTRIIQFHKMI